MRTQEITILDGAMGTMLQKAGLRLGDRPETLSITAPDVVEGIQRRYVQAGTRLLLSNTFCANAHKLAGTGYNVEEVIGASVAVALRACEGTQARVALDIGPIGELLEPLGTLSFDEAYALFAQMIRAGVAAGAQVVFFETFSDLSEIRAGVLALIAKALITMYQKCPKSAVSYIVMFGAFAAAAFLKVPVVLIIICCAVFGIVASAIGRRRTEI